MPDRYAIYYAPSVYSDLWQRASLWLGRDAAAGPTEPTTIGGLDAASRNAITPSANRYGFHATIKAPMALASDQSADSLDAALSRFAADTAPVSLGRLELRSLEEGFLALTPVVQSPELTAFAGEVVAAFDPFRAPLSPEDRARRLKSPLTPRQIELLDLYGYPYVLEQFLLHMTLTDRLVADMQRPVMAAAAEWFAPALADEVMLDRLVLFHEPAAGGPFVRLADYRLRKVLS